MTILNWTLKKCHRCDISVSKKRSPKNHNTMIHIDLFYIESFFYILFQGKKKTNKRATKVHLYTCLGGVQNIPEKELKTNPPTDKRFAHPISLRK